MKTGLVSVVCGVRNGGDSLPGSLCSVLGQQGVDLELIVVDDGSDDGTFERLTELASADPRVRVEHQGREGLTAALRRGCAVARGEFIARHDAGDVSLPGRLAAQVALAESDPAACLVSCGAEFIGPGWEPLYTVMQGDADATTRLVPREGEELRGPSHHGATLFRRTAYEAVGGYRTDFYFAQDLDLWTRLAVHGTHRVVEKVFYQAVFNLSSISLRYRRRQRELAAIIREAALRREEGLGEDDLLERARAVRPDSGRSATARERADGFYFIGACLARRRDPRAAGYLWRAVRARPTHVRAFASLAREGLRVVSGSTREEEAGSRTKAPVSGRT